MIQYTMENLRFHPINRDDGMGSITVLICLTEVCKFRTALLKDETMGVEDLWRRGVGILIS